MTDKQIIYDCPHISFTDWGTYACKLYNPRDKNCLVKGGNCDSNISCPYKQLKAKEQECDRLTKIIDEAKNSKLYLKSFLVGEAVQNEYEQQLDQLKSDNKHLNDLLDQALKELEEHRDALEKVREIAEKNHKTEEELFKIRHSRLPKVSMGVLNGKHNLASEILQICDEVKDV